jgi:hypothetical protein
MPIRILLCIVMGVFVVHIGVMMLIAQFRPKPRLAPRPTPNFVARSATVVDPATGEKTIYREITVSTKLAPGAPPPPPDRPQLEATAAAEQ